MSIAEVISGTRTWHVEQGDALAILKAMPAACVDVCITSPGYYRLRSYLPPGHPDKHLEHGGEETLAEYIQRLVAVFAEVRRVLKDTATLWVNIGDSYSGSGKGGGGSYELDGMTHAQGTLTPTDIPDGNLLGVPWHLAFAMQDDGWILRSEIALCKVSPMPESVSCWRWVRCRVKTSSDSGHRDVKVKENGNHRAVASFKDERTESGRTLSAEGNPTWVDCPGCIKCEKNGGYVLRKGKWRPTRAHESLFLFAKSASYFCDGEAVKTPAKSATVNRDQYSRILDDADEQFAVRHDHETVCSGANLRDWVLWKNENLKEKHYAAFPSFLPTLAIKAGTSEHGNCGKCGMPWTRVVEKIRYRHPNGLGNGTETKDLQTHRRGETSCMMTGESETCKTIAWRHSCSCQDAGEPVPPIVLDCFSGSGTSVLAALRLGHRAIGIDLSQEYVDMARRRIATESLTKDDTLPGEKLPLFAGL